MQFMTMLKAREDQGQPPAEMYAAMGTLIEELTASGNFVSGGGLLPGSAGTTLQLRGGEMIVTDGPFTEATELVGGFAIIEAESLQECVELCKATLQLHKEYWPGWEGYSEIRPIAG